MNNIKCVNIKDGINLYYIPADKFKAVSVSLYFHRKLKKDEASKNALLCDVLSRGCRKYPDDIEVSKKEQELYGAVVSSDVTRKGEDQMLMFTVRGLAEKYVEKNVTDSLNLLLDMVFDPYIENDGFKADYVNQEKINLINDIRAVINDKRSYSVWRLIQNMCEGDSYGVHELGTEEDVVLIDEKNLFDHYKKVLKESPVDIFVTGDVDIDGLISVLKERLKDINPETIDRPTCDLYNKDLKNKEVTEEFDVTQAKLCVGFKTGISYKDEKYPALMVYNGILGGGAHSKLFNNVREKLSLAYYASSSLERYKGLMVISSGIEIANKDKALNEIYAQIKDMEDGNISDYEFTATKLAIINSLKSFGDESAYLKDYYLGQVVGGTMVTLDELIEQIKNVTIDDVIKVSKFIKPQMVYFLTGKGGDTREI